MNNRNDSPKPIVPTYLYGKYRHQIPPPVHNLYRLVRAMLGLRQEDAGKFMGITARAWQHREWSKQMYHPVEFIALYDMSGMSADKFLQMVRDKCT